MTSVALSFVIAHLPFYTATSIIEDWLTLGPHPVIATCFARCVSPNPQHLDAPPCLNRTDNGHCVTHKQHQRRRPSTGLIIVHHETRRLQGKGREALCATECGGEEGVSKADDQRPPSPDTSSSPVT
ncbi:hypothetical protein AC579_4073 [Pseudocercospora musae]|uniref:Secreted protein n=1 Tax=Pseudocercospora musae TaxID=113226 RepID=A0A139IJ92_9PEZI|nr:hypothetical protein AC579_4073 [Pseudocercospora musae]KXT14825.1 hypothetical protein AC579_4073 [Pseudocercospora musae]KXT14827.1 hypothetical protein AC579_4073 [Pseudocercospora musae]KXT14829.1 hypothetical protein AC579_4073 [Pseudocercospora musae]